MRDAQKQRYLLEHAFQLWSGKRMSDRFAKAVDEHTSQKLIAAQIMQDKINKFRVSHIGNIILYLCTHIHCFHFIQESRFSMIE